MRTLSRLSVLALMLALALPVGAAEKLKKSEARTLSAIGLEALEIRTRSGDITVRGEERSDIRLELKVMVKARGRDKAEDLLARVGCLTEYAGAVMLIEPSLDGRGLISGRKRLPARTSVSIAFTLHVPRHLALTAMTSSGDIGIDDLGGMVDLAASSGDVHLRRSGGDVKVILSSGDLVARGIKGNLRASTQSGDMDLKELSGSAELRASSGDVKALNIQGDCNLHLSSGDAELRDVAGALEVSSSSGEILVSGSPASLVASSSSGDLDLRGVASDTRSLRLITSSGEVDIRLGSPADFDLVITTGSGEMSCRLPLELRQADRHRLRGRIGEGGNELQIETGSGDVRIRQEDS